MPEHRRKTRPPRQQMQQQSRPRRLDDRDWRLLTLLQDDARVSNAELARQVNLSAPGLQKRIRRLEARGVIRRYVTLLDRQAVGLDLLCFVSVSLAHHRPDAAEQFRDEMKVMPEVLECHYLTREFDYVMKVVVADHTELERFLFEKLMRVEGVDRVRTSIVLNEIKVSTALPLGDESARTGASGSRPTQRQP
jgi:DNA-binding Lrp family transcriptional regulator